MHFRHHYAQVIPFLEGLKSMQKNFSCGMNLAYVILFHFIHENFETFSVVNFLCIILFVFLIFSNNIPQGGIKYSTQRANDLCMLKVKLLITISKINPIKIYRLLFQIDLPLLNNFFFSFKFLRQRAIPFIN